MKNILDEEYAEKNIDLSQYTFRGKLSGLSWKIEQAQTRITMARSIIFVMSLIVFYPVLTNYLNFGTFDWLWFIERAVFSIIFLLCGLFYNKFRLAALIVSLLPMSLILLVYILNSGYFSVRVVAFNVAVLGIILIGIYFHFKERKLIKSLIEEIRKGNPEAVIRN